MLRSDEARTTTRVRPLTACERALLRTWPRERDGTSLSAFASWYEARVCECHAAGMLTDVGRKQCLDALIETWMSACFERVVMAAPRDA